MKNRQLDPASDANRKQESDGSTIKGALATGVGLRYCDKSQVEKVTFR
jgi:predicted transcriptional regulator with HTH domain